MLLGNIDSKAIAFSSRNVKFILLNVTLRYCSVSHPHGKNLHDGQKNVNAVFLITGYSLKAITIHIIFHMIL